MLSHPNVDLIKLNNIRVVYGESRERGEVEGGEYAAASSLLAEHDGSWPDETGMCARTEHCFVFLATVLLFISRISRRLSRIRLCSIIFTSQSTLSISSVSQTAP